MKGQILILLLLLIGFLSGCIFYGSSGCRPAPKEFIDFAQKVMDSTANFKEILMNSKFEKKDWAFSADAIEREITLINIFKKECGENIKVDEDGSFIGPVHNSSSKVDTICEVRLSCKNKKYKGDNQWQNRQYVPEYLVFGPRWSKRNGSWVFDGFGFIPGVN
jgi:hypothetical protein